ncbi:YoaK family protein [Melissospora conviva]|uniref:YoaK family protein n=1 Tax=Melissospora conviva TaxID=3388432 RepID=UPI003B7C31B9
MPFGSRLPVPGSRGWQDALTEFRFPVAVLALASVVGGLVDAYALIRYRVFVANQSGNVVHVGMGLGGEFADWPVAAASIGGVLIGAALGTVLRWGARPGRISPPARQLTAALLAVATWALTDALLDAGAHDAGDRALLAVLGAAVTGLLAVVFFRVAGVTVVTTYQSTTVVDLAKGLVGWLHRRAGRWAWPWVSAVIGLASYAAGGWLGTRLLRPQPATFVLTAGIIVVLLLTVRAYRVPAPVSPSRRPPSAPR